MARNKNTGFIPSMPYNNKDLGRNTNLSPMPQNYDNFVPGGVQNIENIPNKGGMQMNVGSNKSSRNVTASDFKSKTKPAGGRTGGKFMRRETPPKGNTPFPFLLPSFDSGNPSSTVAQKGSGLGYDVGGQSNPTPYRSGLDNTLFRDEYVRPVAEMPDSLEAENTTIAYYKTMEIDFADSLKDNDYSTEFDNIYIGMYDDVSRNCNASQGALNIFTKNNMKTYLHEISKLFTLMYEYQVISSWNPQDPDIRNVNLRQLAIKASGTEYIDIRKDMQDALAPCILPPRWMTYIRWLVEHKRKNEFKNSATYAFRTPITQHLINGLLHNDAPELDKWKNAINTNITNVNQIRETIMSLIKNKVDCVPFAPCYDYFISPCNTSTFDAEYNNIYKNRAWMQQDADPGSVIKVFPNSNASGNARLAIDTETPMALSLANLSMQINPKSACLPLEGAGTGVAYDTGSGTNWSHWYLESTSNNETYNVRVGDWYYNGDDSTFVVTSALNGIVMPKGDTVQMYYASERNIRAAKRHSFTELFM
jgi:hypothetical protein